MFALWFLVNVVFFTQYALCRDFYMGYMYHPNSVLVAQDIIYKAPPPFGYATASYGRLFKCQISYFRVVDRLGIGRGPYTKVVRGGIGKKFIAVTIKSTHKLPISVNIYVACVKKQSPKKLVGKSQIIVTPVDTTTEGNGELNETSKYNNNDNSDSTSPGSDTTTIPVTTTSETASTDTTTPGTE